MPYLLGAATLARPKNLSIAEGIVAVQNQEDVVQLFDVRDASTLEPAGQIHFPPHPPSFWQRHESFCGTRLLLACTALVEGIERSEVRFWNVADPHSPVSEGLWYRNWEDLEQFEVGPDRLLVCSQPMAWGISPIYSLLDVIEESQPNQTAMWFGQWGVLPRPRHAVLEGGWLASWTTGDGLRMQLDDSILSVEAPHTRPASLTLSAAPNPFNPVTRLEFTLAQAGPVRLAVYDLLGREVAVLLDGTCAAGARSLAFDAAALASGVYFARLETAAGSQTLKLALVR
jgi:hypothetical protein